MKIAFTIFLLVLSGCTKNQPIPKDLARTQASVTFETVEKPSTKGYAKHWTLDTKTAWYDKTRTMALVKYEKQNNGIIITNFPKDFGHIKATGWEDDKNFFVHVSRGADTGTMIYCDLKKKKVTQVKHWGGY